MYKYIKKINLKPFNMRMDIEYGDVALATNFIKYFIVFSYQLNYLESLIYMVT